MARLGMDVDEVERVAGGLHQQSAALQQAISQITTLVNQAVHVWDGQDSRQFADWWNSQHKPALTKASHAIEELSRTAKKNAQDQRQVSGH
ncbi:WXG100 family type VII secretion target [Phycicoccus sp. MAQZ13P-2]|uniref:WXG100 family type VII secretion target n=1 Tax=Phycicoccus mangrovi TaxID=2840470 RepID=UPI001C0004E9|nr:WXG100 family type VII secretion target [Phycicoccus mangrovi]MBT9258041.1 WXG100 family type VII secretion target [Phycicoccus mangrovi]MBT9276025.1 WXG100 family type VII secretion target [Phycicoccus mangrovi]